VCDLPAMLTPAELATMVGVDPKTVSAWARDGRIAAVRTPGGHRRFPPATVLAFMSEAGFSDEDAKTTVRALK